jgi:hypothetical protein
VSADAFRPRSQPHQFAQRIGQVITHGVDVADELPAPSVSTESEYSSSILAPANQLGSRGPGTLEITTLMAGVGRRGMTCFHIS